MQQPFSLVNYFYCIILLDGKVLFKLNVSLDHPVDLYALMDLSGSMQKHKTNLALVAEDIANALKEKTKDYRLGYGSYRDKPRPPFGGGKIIYLNAIETSIVPK